MSPRTKQEYLETIIKRYRVASRKMKTAILDEFCAACEYHRKHALRLLRTFRRFTQKPHGKRGRKQVYNAELLLKPLQRIWKVWGHGFILLYIEGYAQRLPFRRWRCPVCGRVYTIRPYGYWLRHSVPVWTLAEALRYRTTQGFWNKTLGFSRQRQQHWFRALKANIKAHLGMDFSNGFMEGFSELASRGLVPVLRFG